MFRLFRFGDFNTRIRIYFVDGAVHGAFKKKKGRLGDVGWKDGSRFPYQGAALMAALSFFSVE